MGVTQTRPKLVFDDWTGLRINGHRARKDPASWVVVYIKISSKLRLDFFSATVVQLLFKYSTPI